MMAAFNFFELLIIALASKYFNWLKKPLIKGLLLETTFIL